MFLVILSKKICISKTIGGIRLRTSLTSTLGKYVYCKNKVGVISGFVLSPSEQNDGQDKTRSMES
uniref:Uncharacterized protein n=1 Tax=Magallana gigas TaxID=29159 RepID=K1QIG0_MAGGI